MITKQSKPRLVGVYGDQLPTKSYNYNNQHLWWRLEGDYTLEGLFPNISSALFYLTWKTGVFN